MAAGNPFLHAAWLDAHAEVLEPDLEVWCWRGGPPGEVPAVQVLTAAAPDGPVRMLGDRLSDRLGPHRPAAGPGGGGPREVTDLDLLAQVCEAAAGDRRGALLRRLPLTLASALVEAVPGSVIVEVEPSPVIRFGGGGWEAYLAGHGARRRRRAAAQASRVLASCGATVEESTAPDEVSGALDVVVDLHRLRFGPGSRSFDPPKLACVRAALPVMARDGLVLVRVLRLDGRPVAGMLCFTTDGELWFHQGGWDPAFAERAVGRALFADSVRRACDSGSDFRLLRGDEGYKAWWATGDEAVATVQAPAA